jgi:hypothetical protein
MNAEKNLGPMTDAVTSQLTSTLGNRLPASDEAKKQLRAQRFAKEIEAQKKESTEKALDKSQRFTEFEVGRNAGINLGGAYSGHRNDQPYASLANAVAGDWDAFVTYVVQNAKIDDLDLSDDVARVGQKRFEIELSKFFKGTQFARYTNFGQRATIIGAIRSTGLDVFHVGPG